MQTITRAQLQRAMSPSPWDFSNGVLYELCREHPSHGDDPTILSKVLLIGRAYAAAIERGRRTGAGLASDRFYTTTVAPQVKRSGIDAWIEQARRAPPGTSDTFRIVIDVHGRTTELFGKISGLQNRSLASKYLHFHLPEHFYILDGRAKEAIEALSGLPPSASRWTVAADAKYGTFAERCFHLSAHCDEKFGVGLSPRQLDNLLLYRGGK